MGQVPTNTLNGLYFAQSCDYFTDLNRYFARVKDKQKIAYVVPIYETTKKLDKIPRNKIELLELVKSGYARQYHINSTFLNSGATNYSK